MHAILTHTIIVEHQNPERAKDIVADVDISADTAALAIDGFTVGSDDTQLAVVDGKQTITRTVCLNVTEEAYLRYGGTDAAVLARLKPCLGPRISNGACASVKIDATMNPGACP